MIFKRLKRLFSGKLIRNISWLGGAELLNRIFRLGTTVVLARLLSPYDYGMIAIIWIVFEFINVFTLKGGIGGKIIQADAKDVKVLANTAYWLNWILCGSLVVIQCLAAFPIAWFYGDENLILPICVVALVYLFQPVFEVHSALLQRENRLDVMALCNVTQSLIGNILTVVLALLGMGMWAAVLPRLITEPILIVYYYKYHPWRPPTFFSLERWHEIFNFGKNILGVELLNKLRANLDYLLVGHFLGVKDLGIYYFAFNAGLGISLNVMSIIWLPLLPHLCSARNDFKQFRQRYFTSLKMIAMICIPLILLQASLAPFYVPVIYGQKWVVAVPILVLICLSALPRPFAGVASQVLQAIDKPQVDLYWNLVFTVIFAVSLLVAVKWGIVWVAATVLICHALALPLFTIFATRYVFAKTLRFSLSEEKL